jgi:3-hydroxyisobutyrate dehydrogenase-like beta-hydroxyacid dehydrogenase
MTESTSGTTHIAVLRIAVIGYGEVGTIFGRALARGRVVHVAAYDILLADARQSAPMREHAAADHVRLAVTAADAVADADLVISAVTASATRDAAASAAQAMRPGAFLLDVNSASPAAKADCGALVTAAGGRYVEAGVMTSVPPYGIRVPMLIGGPDAAALAPTLAALGFAPEVVSPTLGVASAIKMCRSVMIKGMEALAIESFLAARRYGVEDKVLATLAETFPGMDWETNGSYFWRRVVQHGRRRAEEMREAAATLREVGLEPLMASAIADRHAWVADLAQRGTFAGADPQAGWRGLADLIDAQRMTRADEAK